MMIGCAGLQLKTSVEEEEGGHETGVCTIIIAVCLVGVYQCWPVGRIITLQHIDELPITDKGGYLEIFLNKGVRSYGVHNPRRTQQSGTVPNSTVAEDSV